MAQFTERWKELKTKEQRSISIYWRVFSARSKCLVLYVQWELNSFLVDVFTKSARLLQRLLFSLWHNELFELFRKYVVKKFSSTVSPRDLMRLWCKPFRYRLVTFSRNWIEFVYWSSKVIRYKHRDNWNDNLKASCPFKSIICPKYWNTRQMVNYIHSFMQLLERTETVCCLWNVNVSMLRIYRTSL